MATVTLLYPSGHDFDLKYYLDVHMPLVTKSWGPAGLQSWEILKFEGEQPYQIQATLRWTSLDAWKAAASGPEATTVFGDIPKFTTAQPIALPSQQQAIQQLS